MDSGVCRADHCGAAALHAADVRRGDRDRGGARDRARAAVL